jgi:hypothetical protein
MLQRLADAIYRTTSKVFSLNPRDRTPDWAVLSAVFLILMVGVIITYFQPWMLGLIVAIFLVGGLFSGLF